MSSSTPETAPAVGDLTYEAARAALVKTVQTLEAGAETLDQSLALWERGEALAARCQSLLDGARARLETPSAPPTSVDDGAPRLGGSVPA
jgi:exodeoxyribonuclease VII small subunit